MHRITKNVAGGFVEITVRGFWQAEDIPAFAEDLRQALREFPCSKSLYNFTDAAIQPQDVVAAMQAMAQSPAFAGRRVALYTEGAFARMQAKRVASVGYNMQVFGSRVEALAWLAADPVEPALIAYSG